MSQAKTEYGKVAAPRAIGGAGLSIQRLDMFKSLMVGMVLLTIVSVFHVWSRFKLIDLNLEIAEISRQLKEAEQEQKRLKLEVASLRTPSRIETITKDELGMALPTEQQVIIVK